MHRSPYRPLSPCLVLDIWCDRTASQRLAAIPDIMNVNENVMITGEGGRSSPSTSSSFILELDDNMTKGEFVNVLKDIDDSEMPLHGIGHLRADVIQRSVQLDPQVRMHGKDGKRVDWSKLKTADFEANCGVCIHTRAVGPSRSKGLANRASVHDAERDFA